MNDVCVVDGAEQPEIHWVTALPSDVPRLTEHPNGERSDSFVGIVIAKRDQRR
jgi:hypothetical protein